MEKVLPRSYKNIDKDINLIKFLNAIIGKNLGLYKKNNKNLNPFVNSKEYKFWDFTWIEIILPRWDKNIDKDTIFIKFFECKYRQKFGIIYKKKNNKNLNPL